MSSFNLYDKLISIYLNILLCDLVTSNTYLNRIKDETFNYITRINGGIQN